MNVLRRNTDYAIRAMLHLAQHHDGHPVSVRALAQQEDISYQFACKILQKLQKAKLVKSSMGPKGGFMLSKAPAKIRLLDTVEAIQGPVCLNKCLVSRNACPRKPKCPVTGKLEQLQQHIERFLAEITLEEIIKGSDGEEGKGK